MWKRLVKWLNKKYKVVKKSKQTGFFYLLLVGLGSFVTWLTYAFSNQVQLKDPIMFSDFGLIMIFLAICLGFYHLFDRMVLKDIDFNYEIKGHEKTHQGNIAYALVLVALAIVILAGAITVG